MLSMITIFIILSGFELIIKFYITEKKLFEYALYSFLCICIIGFNLNFFVLLPILILIAIVSNVISNIIFGEYSKKLIDFRKHKQ